MVRWSIATKYIFSKQLQLTYKKYGIDVVMNPIVDELMFLEENGIVLNFITKIYFILGYILGDDKGQIIVTILI